MAAVMLLDGGMGQELEFRGVKVDWCRPLIVAPNVIRAIHRDYIDAGADIITTSNYGVTRRNLGRAGLDPNRVTELNARACELAHEARLGCRRPVLIAGSLPPQSATYRPDLVCPPETLLSLYREQVAVLAEHVDLFVCETMSTAAEGFAAASAACAANRPVWVAWTLHEDHSGRLRSGETIAEAVRALGDLPVSGMLVNCSAPERVTAAMASLVKTGAPHVGGYANTFRPIAQDFLDGDGEPRPDLDPDQYAVHAQRWLDAGATVIGGCCGTRPSHIAKLRELLARR